MIERHLQILTMHYYFIVLSQLLLEKLNQIRRWWVKPLLKEEERNSFGAYQKVFKYIKVEDSEEFQKFVGMSTQQFSYLLDLVKPKLLKRSRRKPLSIELKLCFTLQ